MVKKNEINVIYIVTKLELGGAQKVCIALFDGLKKTLSIMAYIWNRRSVSTRVKKKKKCYSSRLS